MTDALVLARKIIIMQMDSRSDNVDGEWGHFSRSLDAAAKTFIADPEVSGPLVEACWSQVPDLHVRL